LKELLEEEEMEGDNSYDCSSCRRKCIAKRKLKLTSLPPVLNLQLLRFVYDRNMNYKKKLTNKIKFSENLDLKPLMTDSLSDSVANQYSLGAILMHVGKTAYSGHYMAHIKDFQKNKWFQFNDESITELKKKNQLGCTEEESEKTNKEKDKDKEASTTSSATDPKLYSTSNAYLLVYYRTDLVNQMKQTDSNKVSNQHEIINQDNIKLDDWFNKMKSNKTDEFQSKNLERETMNGIYNSLWIPKESKKELRDYYFVNTDFLRRLLSSQNNINSNDIETTCSIQKYICQHNRLNPLIVNKLKLISKIGYDNIIEMYGQKIKDLQNFFLKAYDNQTTRCKDCIINCFEFIKCKERLKNDIKLVKNLLKNEPLIDDISKLTNNTNELNLNSNNDCMIIENNENEKAEIRGSRSNSNDENANNSDTSMNAINENKENSNSSIQNTAYWVGKETLKIWQNLIIKHYESQLPTAKSGETEETDNNNIQPESDSKSLEKDGLELVESTKVPETTASNETAKTEPSNMDVDIQSDSQSVTFFNEDIICPHNNLMPGLNKRLVSSKLWNIIYEKYSIPKNRDSISEKKFKKFTNDNRECKLCLVNN
jgi:hypothetical protein